MACAHLFLTGEVQVGKSTLLRQLLARYFGAPGGFRTCWDSQQQRGALYLLPAAGGKRGEASLVARRTEDGMTVYARRFDALGPALLQPEGDCIVMDELGFLEREALEFQAAVLRALDGALPVLGVIKPRPSPFLDAVRRHPRVRLVTVTPENRDALARTLCRDAGVQLHWPAPKEEF